MIFDPCSRVKKIYCIVCFTIYASLLASGYRCISARTTKTARDATGLFVLEAREFTIRRVLRGTEHQRV